MQYMVLSGYIYINLKIKPLSQSHHSRIKCRQPHKNAKKDFCTDRRNPFFVVFALRYVRRSAVLSEGEGISRTSPGRQRTPANGAPHSPLRAVMTVLSVPI